MTSFHITPADRENAVRLTKQIKAATNEVWVLLSEAYRTKAWAMLGYKNWREWATTEFNMDQSYAYRLMTQAAVISQLKEATKVSPTGENAQIYVSEREARDVVSHMPQVIDQVEAGVPVRVAVERVRESVTRSRFDDGYDLKDATPMRETIACQHEYVCRHCGELA